MGYEWMSRIAALVIVVLLLGISSTVLSMQPPQVTVLAAPQPTVPPKLDLKGANPGQFTMPSQTNPPDAPFPGPVLTGPTVAIVQLHAPPLATTFQQALRDTPSLNEALAIVRAAQANMNSTKQALIAQLTAPPFNARLISTTSIVTSTIIVEVDASLLPQIGALPGVQAVRAERTGQLDNPSHQPPGGPGFGPVLH